MLNNINTQRKQAETNTKRHEHMDKWYTGNWQKKYDKVKDHTVNNKKAQLTQRERATAVHVQRPNFYAAVWTTPWT